MQLEGFSNFCNHASSSGVLFYYTGEFSQNVIGAMSDSLRQQLDAVGASGPARRKVFSTFIEMAQNIVHYANDEASNGSRTGAMAVGQQEGKFYVMCANPVRLEHVERLRAKLEPLRTMTLDEIKQAYKEQLRNEEHAKDSISRGSGLGFLTVARESSEPIEYHILMSSQRNDGHAEFYLRAAI